MKYAIILGVLTEYPLGYPESMLPPPPTTGDSEAPPSLIMSLVEDPDYLPNLNTITTHLIGTTVVESADAVWADYYKAIQFLKTGLFEITVSCKVALGAIDGTPVDWPDGAQFAFGTILQIAAGDLQVIPAELSKSAHKRDTNSSFYDPIDYEQWTDTFIVQCTSIASTNRLQVRAYASDSQNVGSSTPATFNLALKVQRVGDLPA